MYRYYVTGGRGRNGDGENGLLTLVVCSLANVLFSYILSAWIHRHCLFIFSFGWLPKDGRQRGFWVCTRKEKKPQVSLKRVDGSAVMLVFLFLISVLLSHGRCLEQEDN